MEQIIINQLIMSSKQINFFIVPEDLPIINSFFIEHNCLIMSNNVSQIIMSSNYDLTKASAENIHEVFLSKKDFKKNILYKYLANQNYYYFDDTRSYVIQFSIGFFYPNNTKELHSSRLYCKHKFYDKDGILIRKPAYFIDWASHIFKEFKKKFLKSDKRFSGFYFSANSLEWINHNKAKNSQDGHSFCSQQSFL